MAETNGSRTNELQLRKTLRQNIGMHYDKWSKLGVYEPSQRDKYVEDHIALVDELIEGLKPYRRVQEGPLELLDIQLRQSETEIEVKVYQTFCKLVEQAEKANEKYFGHMLTEQSQAQ